MSKYNKLWEYIRDNYKEPYKLTFEQMENILGFSIDNSFYNKKRELVDYGYIISKIDLNEKNLWINKKINIDINNKIKDIRGSIDYCIITFDNNNKLKCSGELNQDASFSIYKKYLNLTQDEIIILKKLLEETYDENKVKINII